MAGPHARKREASVGFLRTPRAAQPQGPASQEECGSGCDPANEPKTQEDLKARECLQLFLETHGTKTYPRWGFPKAAEGLLCLGLPHPESKCFTHLTSQHHPVFYREHWEQLEAGTTGTQARMDMACNLLWIISLEPGPPAWPVRRLSKQTSLDSQELQFCSVWNKGSEMCQFQKDMFPSNWNMAAFEAMAVPKGHPGRGTGILRRVPRCNSRRKLLGSKGPFFLFS